jgi:hypothetical protein
MEIGLGGIGRDAAEWKLICRDSAYAASSHALSTALSVVSLVLHSTMHDTIANSGSHESEHSFKSHPEHSDEVHRAIVEIQKLAEEQPDFAKQLRDMSTTEEVRLALLGYGITISNEALWRHRGSLLKDGQPTWRG